MRGGIDQENQQKLKERQTNDGDKRQQPMARRTPGSVAQDTDGRQAAGSIYFGVRVAICRQSKTATSGSANERRYTASEIAPNSRLDVVVLMT